MKVYSANVTRDGKWWMVAIPELNGLTQARRLSEAELMAREYIAVQVDVPLDHVHVDLSVQKVAQIDVAVALAEIASDHVRAAALEEDVRMRTEQLARRLAEAKVPLRDIGTLMGVSFQRAHQLVSAGGR
ncbi:MAG: hypothetical protein ABI566_03035 [Pseudolysinimonas sp.]